MRTTLVDQLLYWSSTAPDSVAFRWLRDDGSEEAILSFAALETQTSIVSSRLMNEWLSLGAQDSPEPAAPVRQMALTSSSDASTTSRTSVELAAA